MILIVALLIIIVFLIVRTSPRSRYLRSSPAFDSDYQKQPFNSHNEIRKPWESFNTNDEYKEWSKIVPPDVAEQVTIAKRDINKAWILYKNRIDNDLRVTSSEFLKEMKDLLRSLEEIVIARREELTPDKLSKIINNHYSPAKFKYIMKVLEIFGAKKVIDKYKIKIDDPNLIDILPQYITNFIVNSHPEDNDYLMICASILIMPLSYQWICNFITGTPPNFMKNSILNGIILIRESSKAYELNVNQRNPIFHFECGVVKFILGNYKEAIEDYNKAIHLNPSYADAYLNRGNARSELGDYYGAITDYNQAIRLKPDYVEVYVNRGIVKSCLEDYQGAIIDCNNAIQLNPNYADAYLNRGVVKGKLGDNIGVIEDSSKAIQLQPDLAEAYLNRGNAKFKLADYQVALGDLLMAAKLFEKSGNKSMCEHTESLLLWTQMMVTMHNLRDLDIK